MGQADLDQAALAKRFRPVLEAELNETDDLLEGTEGDDDPVVLDQQSTGRLSRMDSIRNREMAIEKRRRRELRCVQIEAALKRMDQGEYGYCVRCGKPIALKRLEADPAFAACVTCAAGKDQQ